MIIIKHSIGIILIIISLVGLTYANFIKDQDVFGKIFIISLMFSIIAIIYVALVMSYTI